MLTPIAAVVLLATGCSTSTVTVPATRTATSFPTPTSTVQPSGFPSDWSMPRSDLTPGVAAGHDTSRICPHVDPALEAARPTSADKAKVYAAYGLTYPQPFGKYELDHLIPIELGGAPNDPGNEFPELNDTPDPAAISAWHLSPGFIHNSKDIVEDVLHQLVCAGKVDLAVAQQAIATDWRKAYVTYVGQPAGPASPGPDALGSVRAVRLGERAPECVTVKVKQPAGPVWLEFCGSGPGRESSMRDGASSQIVDGFTALIPPADCTAPGTSPGPCVMFATSSGPS